MSSARPFVFPRVHLWFPVRRRLSCEKVRQYLLEDIKDKKLVLTVLGISGFAQPIPVSEYEPYFSIHRKLEPKESAQSQPQ